MRRSHHSCRWRPGLRVHQVTLRHRFGAASSLVGWCGSSVQVRQHVNPSYSCHSVTSVDTQRDDCCDDRRVVEFVFTANSIIGNNAVPTAELGEYTGLGTTVSCVGRIVGPLISAPLFAWSLTNGARSPPFNHFLVFLIVSVIQFGMSGVAFCMPRSIAQPEDEPASRPVGARAASKNGDQDEDEDEETVSLLSSSAG